MSLDFKEYRKPLKNIFFVFSSYFFLSRSFINKYLLKNYLVGKYPSLHLGCGEVRMKGFINMDYRATKATDIVHDCTDLSLFPDNSLETVYAHAFFEHVYRVKQLNLLEDIYRILSVKGKVIFLGLPDFEVIARSYLNKEPGIVGKTFDLFNVYRYTHGDPEQYPNWWQEQLHKALFDKDTVVELLKLSGYRHYLIFRYSFGEEKIPVNLGCLACKSSSVTAQTKKSLGQIINQYENRVNLDTIELLCKR